MTWKRGDMCESCAGRKGTEAQSTPGTVDMLTECITSGEPFYCHESTAVFDPENGHATDRHGKLYRVLPQSRWRLCRAWTNARSAHESSAPQRG